MLKAIIEFIGTMGLVPCILVGDLNANLFETPTIRNAMIGGVLWDRIAEVYESKQLLPPATFSSRNDWKDAKIGKGKTRIDHLLTNNPARAIVHDAEIQHFHPIPHHAATFFHIASGEKLKGPVWFKGSKPEYKQLDEPLRTHTLGTLEWACEHAKASEIYDKWVHNANLYLSLCITNHKPGHLPPPGKLPVKKHMLLQMQIDKKQGFAVNAGNKEK